MLLGSAAEDECGENSGRGSDQLGRSLVQVCYDTSRLLIDCVFIYCGVYCNIIAEGRGVGGGVDMHTLVVTGGRKMTLTLNFSTLRKDKVAVFPGC